MTLIFMRAIHENEDVAERLAYVSSRLAEIFSDLLVVSVGKQAYEVSNAAFMSSGCEVQHFRTECYDPRHLFGPDKADWIFNECSPRSGISSLRAFYHRLASEFLEISLAFPDRPLLFYCDALMIELILLVVRQADISELKHFSLMLDVLSVTVIGRHASDHGIQFSLLCYNRAIDDTFVSTPRLRLVK